MLTTKRKLRDRKQFLIKIYSLLGLIVLSVLIGYLTSLKLFYKHGYISPLSAVLSQDTQSNQDTDTVKEKLLQQKIDVDSVTSENDNYKIILKSGEEVIFSSHKDLSQQISSLQFILSRLTMEGRRFTRLDLSFDKPVIVLEK